MKRNPDAWFSTALREAGDQAAPAPEQSARVYARVLGEAAEVPRPSRLRRLARLIADRPWRFAFGASLAQAVLCALIFGARYPGLLLGWMMGG